LWLLYGRAGRHDRVAGGLAGRPNGVRGLVDTEDARQAHLTGEIPTALGQVAEELLAADPDISHRRDRRGQITLRTASESTGVRTQSVLSGTVRLRQGLTLEVMPETEGAPTCSLAAQRTFANPRPADVGLAITAGSSE